MPLKACLLAEANLMVYIYNLCKRAAATANVIPNTIIMLPFLYFNYSLFNLFECKDNAFCVRTQFSGRKCCQGYDFLISVKTVMTIGTKWQVSLSEVRLSTAVSTKWYINIKTFPHFSCWFQMNWFSLYLIRYSKQYLYRGQYLREAVTLRFEGYCPRFYWQFYTIETLLWWM